jgi:hypothetical protein
MGASGRRWLERGVPGQPGHLAFHRVIVADVPGVLVHPCHRARNVSREPVSVPGGDEDVRPPTGKEDRHLDILEAEAPRFRDGEVVVDPAVGTVGEGATASVRPSGIRSRRSMGSGTLASMGGTANLAWNR